MNEIPACLLARKEYLPRILLANLRDTMTAKILAMLLVYLLVLSTQLSAADDADKYVEDLKDPDANVRWAAASTLGSLGDRKAVDPLTIALKDGDFRVRQAAAWSLGELGDAKAAGALIQTLQTRDYYPSYEEDRMMPQENQLRATATEALGKLNSSSAVDPLIQALLDEESSVRAAAAESLGRQNDPKVVEPLILALKEDSYQVRTNALWSLQKINDTRATEPLILSIMDED
ncbi:MAG TPA: HEAT repeat domain-containing protein, partial [Methanothrix sp.]|nr:HEAT repeat domain-containing protein [Methanothrix sp.]